MSLIEEDARDISSAVTVIALDTEAHDQKEYNLTGAALSYEEVAAILTKILQSDTLSLQFCELIRPCLDNSCGIATGLQVQPI